MNRLNILVVDDEMGMRMAVARALESFSVSSPDLDEKVEFNVNQADCGEKALEKLQDKCVDILLLDHKMPGISGLEVLARLADIKCDCLTIMITAYASLETAITATKRGAFDFLAKPFTPEELKAAIRKAAIHLLIQRQARRLAEEKRQVRFQLISVVAHELKAPLGAIEGYLYLLRDRPAGDSWETYEKAVGRSLIRLQGMRKLITDLLDLTRIESGQKKRELTEVDVKELAEMAVETVLPEAEQREITVNLKTDDELIMTADRSEIEIILNNLLTNAVKYNRDGGKVDATITRDDGHIKIEVIDTGIGMTEQEAARLFNDFVRIKNQKTKNILGSGLGLSIVKKIAQLYHGDVAVRSQPDVGSTFTVTLGHTEAEDDDE